MPCKCSKCKGTKAAAASSCKMPCPGGTMPGGSTSSPPKVSTPVAPPSPYGAEKILELLVPLTDKSRVAVLNFVGSLCPITKGHVDAISKARDILLGKADPAMKLKTPFRPYDECLAYVRVNSDGHVGHKLSKKGEASLGVESREHLVRLAASHLPWLHVGQRDKPAYMWAEEIKNKYEGKLPVIWFRQWELNGADDVVKYKKWQNCSKKPIRPMITMGRGEATAIVRTAIESLDESKQPRWCCLLGPEIEGDFSSSKARKALHDGNAKLVKASLHTQVYTWCMTHGAFGASFEFKSPGGVGGSSTDPIEDDKHKKSKTSPLTRWMVHRRPADGLGETLLRSGPSSDAEQNEDDYAMNEEVVEVLESKSTEKSTYAKVRLALPRNRMAKPNQGPDDNHDGTGAEGWLRREYLHDCTEGEEKNDAEGKAVTVAEGDKVTWLKLEKGSARFKEIERLIENSWHKPTDDKEKDSSVHNWMCIPCYKEHYTELKLNDGTTGKECMKKYPSAWKVNKIWFLHGHFLGQTGMWVGPKVTLFHGCKDKAVGKEGGTDGIANCGFNVKYCSGGAVYGKGHYFSPQACKAFSYAENHLLVCEVALGDHVKRHTITGKIDKSLNYLELRHGAKDMRSAQAFPGKSTYGHMEHIVYGNTQCKPVYVVEMKYTSSCKGS